MDSKMFREAEFSATTRDNADGTKIVEVRASFSSEAPYTRYMPDPETHEYVKCYEVLGHKDEEIDRSRMNGGLIIQDTHHGDQIGLCRNPVIADGKLGGVIEFCSGPRAQEIKADAEKGLRRNMSIGYIIREYKRDGVADDGLPIFRVTKWTPYEASFVNVPADTGVGVGRSEETTPAAQPAVETQTKGVQIMDKPETKAGYTAEQKVKIRELASAAHVTGEEVTDILLGEKSFEEVREELLNRREKYLTELAAKKPAETTAAKRSAIDDGAIRAEVAKRGYNIVNVIRYMTDMADHRASKIDIGFEAEISQELAQKTGRAVQGILLPDFIGSRAAANASDGSLTTGTPAYNTDTAAGGITGIGGTGKATIATNLLAGNFIEALRDALVLSSCGTEVITGLVGDIAVPKGGTITGGWTAKEGDSVAKKNPTFGQITATPHTYGAYVDITRKLLLQSSIDVQSKIMEWLLYACAAGLETAAFQGTGTNGEPTGVVTATTAAAHVKAWSNTPTFDKVVELIAAAKTANSYKPSMRFIGDSGVWAKLATTLDYLEVEESGATVAAVGGVNRLLDLATNRLAGHQFVESHLMSAKTLLFGDFSQLALCLWSGTDITVDPYANATSGGLRIVALQDSDVLIKTPESFCKATGVHA